MMIRWTFHYKDTPINIETADEKEDSRISEGMTRPSDLFQIATNDGMTLFLNIRECLLIVRKVLTEKEIAEIAARNAPKEPEAPKAEEKPAKASKKRASIT